MKIKNFLKLALCLVAAISLVGCATKLASPVVTPANPATGAPAVTNYYVPNAAVMTGVTYTNAAAPLIPAPWGTAATAVATLAALVAGYIAQKKNTQANASSGAAAALSAAIVAHTDNAALSAAALSAGQSNGSVGAVAENLKSANSPT
jgi:TRAP-type C4-dicarboxylate transport system permease small subunit